MNPMNTNGCPCFDCAKRTESCHGECEEYKQWAEKNKHLRRRKQEMERLTRWRLEK